MNARILAVSTLLAAGVGSSSVNAAVIAEWDLLGAAGSQASTAALPPVPLGLGVTGDPLARGSGLAGSTASNSISASGWNGQATDYFSLGFTVAPGYSVDLTSLYIGTRSSNTGPGTLGLFYSGDGFATNLFSFNQAPGGNFVNSIVDLSALPNLTGSVEFRIFQVGTNAANGGATGSSGTFRLAAYFDSGTFDRNLQFTGDVSTAVIPEPSAAWLAIFGLAGLGTLARRVRTAAH
jgi:hypothetical protein